jgi:fructose transport system substrate-binding protein
MKFARYGALIAVLVFVIVGIATGSRTRSGGGGGHVKGSFKLGLITKTNSNPYFVSMLASAKAEAKAKNVQLLSAAGKLDGDNQSQIDAVENMIAAGVKAIMIVPNDSTGIIPALQEAQKHGIYIVDLDTQTTGNKGVDVTYATDNFQAGVQQGKYVKAALGSKKPRIAMLDLELGNQTGDQRHNGFLQGMGIKDNSPDISGRGNTNGDQGQGQSILENLLQKDSKINAVYSINEAAAMGGATAIKEAGKSSAIVLGAIDGGCSTLPSVKAGSPAATVMQFPGKMAKLGIDTSVAYIRNGVKPKVPSAGFIDTGEQLITDKPIKGLPSQNTDWGLQHCWGGKS